MSNASRNKDIWNSNSDNFCSSQCTSLSSNVNENVSNNNDCNSLNDVSIYNNNSNIECTLMSHENFIEFQVDSNITLKSVTPHIVSNSKLINTNLFASLLYLSIKARQATTKQFDKLITQQRLALELANYNKRFNDQLSLTSALEYFKINFTILKVKQNGSLVRLINPNLTFKGEYKGIILIQGYNIFILRSYYKKSLNFPNKNSGYCIHCSHLFTSKPEHVRNCTVTGTNTKLAKKITIEPACESNNISQILDVLKLKETTNSREPIVYMKRSINIESSSTISLDNIQNIKSNLFGLFFL